MSPEKLDELFEKTAQNQYTREILFSEIVELMMPVVMGRRPSVHASYQARKEQLGVSGTSVYNKINGIEPNEACRDSKIFCRSTPTSDQATTPHQARVSTWISGQNL